MSGIEIAGLILGALPILHLAVEDLKDGAKAVLRFRTYIEKLSLALLLQQSILIEVFRSILLASGYVDVWRLDDDPVACLNDPVVRQRIVGFLGLKNSAAFSGLIMQTDRAVKEIARNISGLSPEPLASTDNLLIIIEANKGNSKKGRRIIRKFKLLFWAHDLRAAIEEIDKTTDALQRFARIVSLNRQATEGDPTRKAVELAKCLRKVRGFASNLYLAVFRGLQHRCHDEHEANLYLDDRVEIAEEILETPKLRGCVPSLTFQLLIAATTYRSSVLCHQAMVQVMREAQGEDSSLPPVHQVPGQCQVTLAVPSSQRRQPEVTEVESICDAIEEAGRRNANVALVLAEYQQIGTMSINSTDRMLIPYQHANKITLRDLLSARTQIPLKFRVLLALRLSSNLLQLLHTPWLRNGLFEDAVLFLTQPATTGSIGNISVNFERPFISVKFMENTSAISLELPVDPKMALLELGIVLLELWHGKSLEDHFLHSSYSPLTDFYERRELALRWLEDMEDPLPQLYDKAASNCIRGVLGGKSRFNDWEDATFWNLFCVDVIQPLFENCKHWTNV